MKVFLTALITVAIIIVIVIAFAYSGRYNVAAINPTGGLENWFFSTVTDNSVKHHSDGIIAPALDGAAMVDSGFVRFSRMCAGCHGAPGVQSRGAGRNMNPKPPDLAEEVGDLSDAEIFWIIKNGIKMTGMPAYGANNDDNRIWEITAFVRLLPKMSDGQYMDYKNRLGQEER